MRYAVLSACALLLTLVASSHADRDAPGERLPPQPPPIRVLVADQNLFEGNAVIGRQVRVRGLRPEELEHYWKYKDQYLPPLPAAAHLRVAAQNIAADTPLLRGHFGRDELPPEMGCCVACLFRTK